MTTIQARPAEAGEDVKLATGTRYMTRAVVRIAYIHPFDPWRYVVCVIERRVDGSVCDPERPCKISLCPDGRYFPRDEDYELDLVAEVQELGSIAA